MNDLDKIDAAEAAVKKERDEVQIVDLQFMMVRRDTLQDKLSKVIDEIDKCARMTSATWRNNKKV